MHRRCDVNRCPRTTRRARASALPRIGALRQRQRRQPSQRGDPQIDKLHRLRPVGVAVGLRVLRMERLGQRVGQLAG